MNHLNKESTIYYQSRKNWVQFNGNQTELMRAITSCAFSLPAYGSYQTTERLTYLHKTILERDKEKIGTILAKEVAKGIKATVEK